jgi:hypothetical protein
MEVGAMPKETTHCPAYVNVEVGWTRSLPDLTIVTLNRGRDGVANDSAPGWVAHLDRDSANRLIRSLRKARDQAFGPDV